MEKLRIPTTKPIPIHKLNHKAIISRLPPHTHPGRGTPPYFGLCKAYEVISHPDRYTKTPSQALRAAMPPPFRKLLQARRLLGGQGGIPLKLGNKAATIAIFRLLLNAWRA